MKVVGIRFDTAPGRGTVPIGAPPSGVGEPHLWRIPGDVVREPACFPLAALPAGGDVRVTVELESAPAPSTRIWVRAIPHKHNILGAIPEIPVDPGDWRGTRCKVAIDIDAATLRAGGVDQYHAAWQWQWRSDAKSGLLDIGLTEHLLFVTITPPTEPWSGTGTTTGPRTVPWLAPLMQACRWGRGATTHQQAASRIVQSLFALGGPRRGEPCLEYYGDLATYLDHGMANPRWFDCEGFLKDVAGGSDECLLINCYEGAVIVVTFANLLGCALVPCVLEGDCFDPYHVNHIQPLGMSSAPSPDRFLFHVVALDQVRISALSDDLTYDLTLRIDGDSRPSRQPVRFVLADGIPLGDAASPPGTGTYFPQLIASRSIQKCQARTMERPWVGAQPVQDSVDTCPLARYTWYLRELQNTERPAGSLSPAAPLIAGYRGREIYAHRPGVPRTGFPRQPLATQFLFTSNVADSGHAIRVDWWTDDDPWITLSFMAELLAMIELPVEPVTVNGEPAYTVPRRTSLLVLHDGVAARYSSVGPAALDMVQVFVTAVSAV